MTRSPSRHADVPRAGSWSLQQKVGEVCELIEDYPFVVGRGKGSQLVLDNPTVSISHAQFITSDGLLYVTDLGSTNGTLLNGCPVNQVVAVESGDVVHVGDEMLIVLKDAQPAHRNQTVRSNALEVALAEVHFDELLSNPDSLYAAFQPIVSLENSTDTVAHEALIRSPLDGLESPHQMFRVAAQRRKSVALSERARHVAAAAFAASSVPGACYVNAHPSEMFSCTLIDSLADLRQAYPQVPFVFEVPESASLSIEQLRSIHDDVRQLGIQMAYDDFGAGQARVIELAEVPPSVVKFDIRVVQRLPQASSLTREAIRRLVELVRDLGATPLAEGIETPEQARICREIGFGLGQGFLFGRPAPLLPNQTSADELLQ